MVILCYDMLIFAMLCCVKTKENVANKILEFWCTTNLTT